jgi:hypothetical protein
VRASSRQDLAIDQVMGDASFTGANTGRRDFLKFLGFGLGAATLAACETPVIKSIPYVTKPEDLTPAWPTGMPAPSMMARISPASW